LRDFEEEKLKDFFREEENFFIEKKIEKKLDFDLI
jgi:hypothetical protein